MEKIIFEKCFLGGEGIATAVALSAATDDLRVSLDMRNDLIAEFRKNPPATEEAKVFLYLGLPAAGARDERIKDNIYALCHQVDDCIFFSRRLADAVLTAENKLRRKNSWKYRLPGRKLKPARWTIAEKAGLRPLDAQYADWLRGFVKDPTRLERLTRWLLTPFRRSMRKSDD